MIRSDTFFRRQRSRNRQVPIANAGDIAQYQPLVSVRRLIEIHCLVAQFVVSQLQRMVDTAQELVINLGHALLTVERSSIITLLQPGANDDDTEHECTRQNSRSATLFFGLQTKSREMPA